MNLIDTLKKKRIKEGVKEKVLNTPKKALNVDINIILKRRLMKLAAEYGVHLYAMAEHAIQVGIFYLDKAQQNSNIKDIVHGHLIDHHQLSSTDIDPEEILRLGEGRFASELIILSRRIAKYSRDMQRAFYQSQRTGDFSGFEQARKQFIRSCVALADWLSTNPLDEMEAEEDS